MPEDKADLAFDKSRREIEDGRARLLEGLKTIRPELFSVERVILRRNIMVLLEDLHEHLLVLQSRGGRLMLGVDEELLDRVETILEEYGWEGVGR